MRKAINPVLTFGLKKFQNFQKPFLQLFFNEANKMLLFDKGYIKNSHNINQSFIKSLKLIPFDKGFNIKNKYLLIEVLLWGLIKVPKSIPTINFFNEANKMLFFI